MYSLSFILNTIDHFYSQFLFMPSVVLSKCFFLNLCMRLWDLSICSFYYPHMAMTLWQLTELEILKCLLQRQAILNQESGPSKQLTPNGLLMSFASD